MVRPRNIHGPARNVFMKLPASFNMFERGWGGPGKGLLHHYIQNVIFRVQLGLTSGGYLGLALCAPVNIAWCDRATSVGYMYHMY